MAATRTALACPLIVAVATLLAACPRPAPRSTGRGPTLAPAPVVAVPGVTLALRIRIAHAEARQGGGVDELVALATQGDGPVRLLALRGLGRIGGTRAAQVLRTALTDPDPAIAAGAAGALGVLVTLAEQPGEVPDAALAAAVRARSAAQAHAAVQYEALGRIGTLHDVAPLAVALAPAGLRAATASPWPPEQAALAIARWGRRKHAIDARTRELLVGATVAEAPAVRYAATYALGREHEPASTEPRVVAALAARLVDPDANVRAATAYALGKRKLVPGVRSALVRLLADPDWRVAVEAVRALAGAAGDAAAQAAVAAQLPDALARVDAEPPRAHVVLEAVRALAAHSTRPEIAARLLAFQGAARAAHALPALTRGWFDCLATLALARSGAHVHAASFGALETCGGGGLPDHLRLPLVAEAVVAGAGSLAARRAGVARLQTHADVRVRAAALTTLVPLALAGDARDRDAATATLVAALGAPDAMLAGTAGEAIGALLAAPAFARNRDASIAAVLARAARETDVELAASLLGVITQHKLVTGAATCRDAFGRHPVLDRAAAACLRALGQSPPPVEPLVAALPPVDVSAVIGKRLEWRLTTSRGELHIALHPEHAPWAVATVVALTRRGFYTGREVHRVVADFVAQTGDPTDSGWGGPGFVLPPEPASVWDPVDGERAGFATGGVGLADAGPGSGGSQWFVMHGRAPHLDGRYTWFGVLRAADQPVLDALLVGDRITAATIHDLAATTAR